MGSVTLTEDVFGCHTSKQTNNSAFVRRFTWTNKNNISVQVINYGATITSMKIPDKSGKVEDIVLGFDNMKGYENPLNPYCGAAIGRVGNRIRDSKFKIDGQEYELSKNFRDTHQIHGGLIGFDKVDWDCYVDGTKVIMSYDSKDGEEGFPGNILVNLLFELVEDQFIMKFRATTTKPTITNLTHHSYFNLAGHDKGKEELEKHIITINADSYTEVDDHFFPTGKITPVSGTPFDLRIPKILGDEMPKVPHCKDYADGYDHNFCITKGLEQDIGFVARVEHPPSGRVIEFYSNQPGVQFYTSNTLQKQEGKGATYDQHGAFCMEPQNYPDAINQDNFPRVTLYPGETYKNTIIYKFL